MLSIAINVLLVIHVLVSLLIILLTLMQRPKNEGLGAAFGGGMTENLFGAQTTNVLQTTTRYLGGIFFALTLLLSWLYVKDNSQKNSVNKRLMAVPALATPAPASKAPEKPAATTEEKKPALVATPAPEKPAASTPAPALSPATPATPAPEAPKPDASAKPGAAPTQPSPETPAAEKPATPPADK